MLIGVLFERLVLRRMIGRPPFTIIMVTIGLNVLLLTAVTLVIGAKLPRSPAPFDFAERHQRRRRPLRHNALATIVTTGLICAALYVFFRYHALWAGDARHRARPGGGAGDGHQDLAWSMRWPGQSPAPSRRSAASSSRTNNPTFDVSLGNTALVAFPAIILGGLDSIPGAVVGGVIIGVIYELLQGYASYFTGTLGTGFYVIVPYLVMILVLLIRPYGLFGTRKVERV